MFGRVKKGWGMGGMGGWEGKWWMSVDGGERKDKVRRKREKKIEKRKLKEERE